MALSNGDHTNDAHRFPDVVARIGAAAAEIAMPKVSPVEVSGLSAEPLSALVVTTAKAWRKGIVGACLGAGMAVACEERVESVLEVLGRDGEGRENTMPRKHRRPPQDACATRTHAARIDLVIVDAELDGWERVVDAAKTAGAAVVLGMHKPSAERVIEAMRQGVSDVLERGAKRLTPETGERILALANGSRNQRLGAQRICALRGLCRRLNSSRREVVRQVDALCSDLLVAYQEIEAHMNQVSTATEFKGLIKGELDIEALLRTTLEFVLSRSGPTNAAVFLPTTSGDYSLGAYVNYDCPKETCDVLLDHLANVIAPKFERTTGLINLTTPEQLERYIADDADWLNGSNVVGYACRHDNEVLAIFMLFRDRKSGFAQNVLDQVKTVGELFAAQLARVIHIHHRHLPKDKWGMMGDPNEGREDDYGDLAA